MKRQSKQIINRLGALQTKLKNMEKRIAELNKNKSRCKENQK